MQLELFKPDNIDKRRGYYLLPKYKVAVPVGFHDLSTIDLYLAEREDYKTSLGDIKRVMETRDNLLAKGYSFLSLLVKPQSNYEDWHRKTYPVKIKTSKPMEYVYDL